MKCGIIAAALALSVSGFSLAQANTVGSILAQGSDGNVYRINVGNATATLFRELGDFNEQSSQAGNSPNALGFSVAENTTIRSTFGNQASRIYLDNDLIATIPNENSEFAIAAGDLVGSTYYYITGAGRLGTITDVFNNPIVNLRVDLAGRTFGDLVVRGDNMFVSRDSVFELYSLSAALAGGATPLMSVDSIRFAGLAFAGDTLFGFTVDDRELFSISTALDSTFGTRTPIGQITGVEGIVTGDIRLTDAAPIPLPAGVWLMLTGVAGAAALRRRKARQAV